MPALAAVWVPTYTETYMTAGSWTVGWTDGSWNWEWVEPETVTQTVPGYWGEETVAGHPETQWIEGSWDPQWSDGYWDTQWVDGYSEPVWNEGSWGDVWSDGWTDEEGNWNDGSWSPSWTEGSWGTTWVEGSWSSTWVDGSWSNVWSDGHNETVWVDGYTTPVWVNETTENVVVPGYYTWIWSDGYWGLVAVPPQPVTVTIEGHWEGEWTWTASDYYGEWSGWSWSPSAESQPGGVTFTQSGSRVRSHVHMETNEAGDDRNWSSLPEYETSSNPNAVGTGAVVVTWAPFDEPGPWSGNEPWTPATSTVALNVQFTQTSSGSSRVHRTGERSSTGQERNVATYPEGGGPNQTQMAVGTGTAGGGGTGGGGGPAAAPSITSPAAASASYGASFLYQITASNSPTGYSASGLPAGLTLNPTSGAIAGAPLVMGGFLVAIRATNAIGTSEAATLTLTIAKGTPVGTFPDRTFLNTPLVTIATSMLNATFAAPAGSSLPAPTGTITYQVLVGTALAPTGPGALGKRLTPDFSPITIRADYHGDANYAATSADAVFSDLVVYTPTPPADVRPVLVGPTSLSVHWLACGGVPPGLAPDFVFDVSKDNGATVAQTVTGGALSAVLNGLTASTIYAVRVRGRDQFGNVSAWSDLAALTTSAPGTVPSAPSRWIDANGDGLADEITEAGSPSFEHFIVETSTVTVTYSQWVQDWSYIPGFFYTTGRYGDGYGQTYYVPGEWVDDWYEETVYETVPVVRPEFRFMAEPGYDYRVGRLTRRTNGDYVFGEIFSKLDQDTVDGINSWLAQGFWSEARYYGLPFVLVRNTFAPGGCVLTLPGMDALRADRSAGTITLGNGTTITAGAAGATVTIPGVGSVTIRMNGMLTGDLGAITGMVTHTAGMPSIGLPGGITVNPGTGEVTIAGPAGSSVTVGGPGGLRVALPPGLASIAGIIGKAVDTVGNILGIGTDPNKTKVDNGDGIWRDLDDPALVGTPGTQNMRVGVTDNDNRAPQPANIFTITFTVPSVMTKKVASGDIAAITWGNAAVEPLTQPIYAGDNNGDMVGWSLNDLLPGTYSWSATGPFFDNAITLPLTIQGPSGENVKEWRIARGDGDVNHDWIDWKPGTYRIKCQVQRPWGQISNLEYNQRVGWRSRRYLVAGQVRPLQDYSLTPSQKTDLQAALLLGVDFGPNWNAAFFSALPLDELITAWMVAHGPNGLLGFPQVTSFPASVTEAMKFYMLQQELNNNPDEVDLRNLSVMDTAKIIELASNQSYRMYSEYQVKYVLSEYRRLQTVETVGSPTAWSGPTKITIWSGLAGLINGAWLASNLPSLNLPTNGSQILIPSLENRFNNVQRVDRINGKVSLYTSARIGREASGPNYALFERDVPYIFNEIVFGLDEFGRDRTNQVRLSMNIVWNQTVAGSGLNYFNEISLYEKVGGSTAYSLLQQYRLDGGAQMVRPFILSVPTGQFPTIEPQPLVLEAP